MVSHAAVTAADGDRGINVTLSYNQDGGHKEIMESIIGDLAKVGVTAVSDTPEWSALLEQYQNFNYQFGRLGWIADYPIMDNFLYPLFHSDSLGGDNRSGYNNPEFDAKVDEARTTVDDEERVAKMQEADAMVAADCPVIPVMFYTHTIVGSDRIKHLYVDPQKHAELGTAELA
jgi:oligopeptide transport system substrate-binding protein